MHVNVQQPAHLLRRLLLLLIACAWSMQMTAPGTAYAQSGGSGITTPTTGSSISGDVPVFGTAVIEPFQKYELHYKLEPSGDDAYIYFLSNTSPVQNGQLGIWEASGLAPGVYSLRLRVVKNDGNYEEYFARNLSVNQGPEATPTPDEPTPTPIPTNTFTPAPQPTPIVGQVDQPAVEIQATPTEQPTPQAVAAVEPGQSDGQVVAVADASSNIGVEEADVGGSVTRELGEALSLRRLRSQFLNGVRFSAALFLGIAALYAGKRLFDWVWTQFA